MPRRRRCAIPSTTSTTSNLADIAEVWRRGSVVASWLLDLTAIALVEIAGPGELLRAEVSDSGEGRWTIKAAIDEGTPAPVLTAALYSSVSARAARPISQNKLLSAMRFEFGGHSRNQRERGSSMGTRWQVQSSLASAVPMGASAADVDQ